MENPEKEIKHHVLQILNDKFLLPEGLSLDNHLGDLRLYDISASPVRYLAVWPSLDVFLFSDNYSVFVKCKRFWLKELERLDDGQDVKSFHEMVSLVNSGSLSHLQNCSSYEEVLLKLEVMI